VPFWDKSGSSQIASCAIEAPGFARKKPGDARLVVDGANFLSDRSCGFAAKNFPPACEPGDSTVFDARIAANQRGRAAADRRFRAAARRRLHADSDHAPQLHQRRAVGAVYAVAKRQNNPVGHGRPLDIARRCPDIPLLGAARSMDRIYPRRQRLGRVDGTPAYLYRFPTQRSRVAEFYEAFLCKSVRCRRADARVRPTPPTPANRENNLAKRCGPATIVTPRSRADRCHIGARYSERQRAQFLDPARFPKFDAKCRDCAAGPATPRATGGVRQLTSCKPTTGRRRPNPRSACSRSYLYRTAADEPNVAGGPQLLAARMMETGDIERCVVTRMWREFLGRPMTADEPKLVHDTTRGWVSSTTAATSKHLIRNVVTTDDAYRRID